MFTLIPHLRVPYECPGKQAANMTLAGMANGWGVVFQVCLPPQSGPFRRVLNISANSRYC